MPQDPAAASVDSTLRVGEVRLELLDIFTEEEVAAATGLNRTLRTTMNTLHVNTRPWVVRQELLFATGDPLDPVQLEESERNLRGLAILNEIDIAPVDTSDAGDVAVRVTTRETWTLGLSLSFALASSGNLRWNLSLTEKNFLGYGTVVRGAVGQGLDASYGRIYVRQNRVLRSPFSVEFNYDDRSDGHDRWAAVTVPFRFDDQTWAMRAYAWNRRYDVRWYLSNGGPAGADPASEKRLYALLPARYDGAELEVYRRLSPAGRGRIWRGGLACHVLDRAWDLGSGVAGALGRPRGRSGVPRGAGQPPGPRHGRDRVAAPGAGHPGPHLGHRTFPAALRQQGGHPARRGGRVPRRSRGPRRGLHRRLRRALAAPPGGQQLGPDRAQLPAAVGLRAGGHRRRRTAQPPRRPAARVVPAHGRARASRSP